VSPPDETITRVARWNDSENESSPVPKPAPSPFTRNARCTAIITNDDADARHFISRRVRSASAYERTRVYVCANGAKKRVSHLYRLAPYRSEVYLAVDWHENPVEAFIMGGAVRREKKKVNPSGSLADARRRQLLTRHRINWFISQLYRGLCANLRRYLSHVPIHRSRSSFTRARRRGRVRWRWRFITFLI